MSITDEFRKDMYVMFEGKLHFVEDRLYKTQGRQGGLIILKMKNLRYTVQNTNRNR